MMVRDGGYHSIYVHKKRLLFDRRRFQVVEAFVGASTAITAVNSIVRKLLGIDRNQKS